MIVPAFTTADGRKYTRPKISRFDRGEWGGYLKTPPRFNITNTQKTGLYQRLFRLKTYGIWAGEKMAKKPYEKHPQNL